MSSPSHHSFIQVEEADQVSIFSKEFVESTVAFHMFYFELLCYKLMKFLNRIGCTYAILDK